MPRSNTLHTFKAEFSVHAPGTDMRTYVHEEVSFETDFNDDDQREITQKVTEFVSMLFSNARRSIETRERMQAPKANSEV